MHLTSSGPDPFVGWGPLPGDPLRTYSRGINARSIAEWIIGAILHFHRDFGHYVRSSDEGKWERRWARELRGRTMVVLGAGAAGAEAARLASALDLRTIGVSRSGRPLPGCDRMVRSDQVDMVWGLGDVTVVLLPLTPQTRGSIGAERIVRLKAGSLLLVVSRGGIVDEQVVVQAVRSGHLAGAAFDVFSQEPLPADSPLRRSPLRRERYRDGRGIVTESRHWLITGGADLIGSHLLAASSADMYASRSSVRITVHGQPARGEHRILQEARKMIVPVGERVDVPEQPVAESGPDRGVALLPQSNGSLSRTLLEEVSED